MSDTPRTDAEERWAEWNGNEFEVATLPKHAHEFIDPLSELAENVHPDKIIVVNREGGAPESTTAVKGQG